MASLDIGKDLNKLKPEITIFGPEISTETEILQALSMFLDKRMPWER